LWINEPTGKGDQAKFRWRRKWLINLKVRRFIDAVIKNDLALVRDLIDQGIKLDARSDDGTTVLYEAVMSSYEEIALVLMRQEPTSMLRLDVVLQF
jgi:hypothetical protein